jgi:uncharacterized membrane protein
VAANRAENPGIVLAGAAPRRFPALLMLGIFGQLAGYFVAYYRARRRVMPHAVQPTSVRQADLAPRPLALPGGWILQLGPFVVIAAVAVYLRQHWAEIPARFPIHWGMDGQPNGWATRSAAGVYGPLLTALALCGLMVLLAYATGHWSRRIQVTGPSAEHESHFRRAVLSILLATEYLLALIFAWTAVLPLTAGPAGPRGASVILLLVLAFTVSVTAIMIHTGQGGTRLSGGSAEAASVGSGVQAVGDRTLDRYWKAGIFYVNPDDPALIVEKRFGIGYTVNFGRPASWVILGLIILVPLLVAFLAKSA